MPFRLIVFQSTLPRRERRSSLCSGRGTRHFNPRSREGSDSQPCRLCVPCRDFNPRSREGSDTKRAGSNGKIIISIHAPAKGATRWARRSKRYERFQSTLPRRERRCIAGRCRGSCYFNPRSREGSDVIDAIDPSADLVFQSTLPRRERRSPGKSGGWMSSDFNPRSREGSDQVVHFGRPHDRISIHAPAKGATTGGMCS